MGAPAGADGRRAPAQAEQLVLSPFAAGELVRFYSERGWRTGRFVRIAVRGPRRGRAQVVIGGRLMPEARVWVSPERLAPVTAREATAPPRTGGR
jgi:hypothetical protein